MSAETIIILTDIATIFLAINVIIMTLVVAAVLGFAWWYLRKGRKKLELPFLYAQVYALRVQKVTMQACDAVARVPIEINANAARVGAFAHTLRYGRNG
jgi:hypothetical protein